MAEDNKTCWSAFLYSFFSGALLGAGFALLFAPVSGIEARHSIANEFGDLKEKLVQLEEKLHKNKPGLSHR
jgi:gas vesicle protein